MTVLRVVLAAALLAANTRALDVAPYVSTTIEYDPYAGPYADGTPQLPFSDPRIARTVTGVDPEQIHLTLVNATSVVVSWATGQGMVGVTAMPSNSSNSPNYGVASVVRYGTSPNGTYAFNTSNGYTTSYTQVYTGFGNSNPALNYSSPLIHHVTLTNLTPNTTYYYQCGDPALGLSGQFNFTTLPPVGTYPLRIGVIADVGQTANSSDTYTHLLADSPQVVVFVGDFAYSDDSLTNGTQNYNLTTGTLQATINPNPSPIGTYQPRWDSLYRLAQPVFSTIPLMSCAGNHELEPQGNGTTFLNPTAAGVPQSNIFTSYLARNPIPFQASGSNSPLYYSVNAGPAHFVYINNYYPFWPGSDQYNFLVNDLASVNRTLTPWLIVSWHAPIYHTYTMHYGEMLCFQNDIEPLLYAAGVDVVLNGHIHAYHRSVGVYNYTNNDCGAVHITMGDGGNIEGLYKTFTDGWDNGNCTTCCPNPATSVPNYQPGGNCARSLYPVVNATTQQNGFCAYTTPSWVAFRQPAFGHGILELLNSTTAMWQWQRNQDAEGIAIDTVYLTRNSTCPNRAGATANAAAAPSAASVSNALPLSAVGAAGGVTTGYSATQITNQPPSPTLNSSGVIAAPAPAASTSSAGR
jgi:hypothetical protein